MQESLRFLCSHRLAGHRLADIPLFASQTFPHSLSPPALAECDLPLASPTMLLPENETPTQLDPQPATYICEEQEWWIWKKSGSNPDFPIGANMTNSWESASKKRGPEKGKENPWTAGGWVLVHVLCYAKCVKPQHGAIFVPYMDLLQGDGEAEALLNATRSPLLLKCDFMPSSTYTHWKGELVAETSQTNVPHLHLHILLPLVLYLGN